MIVNNTQINYFKEAHFELSRRPKCGKMVLLDQIISFSAALFY